MYFGFRFRLGLGLVLVLVLGVGLGLVFFGSFRVRGGVRFRFRPGTQLDPKVLARKGDGLHEMLSRPNHVLHPHSHTHMTSTLPSEVRLGIGWQVPTLEAN